MIRWPALLSAGCAVCAGLILVGFVFIGDHRGLSGAPLPPAQIEPAAPKIRKLADPPLQPAQRRPATPSSAHQDGSPLSDVRLTGVVIAPHLRIAIFAVSGANPLVLSEGEALKDWRIESISPERVVLGGQAGNIVLEPKSDPALVRSPPPAAVETGQFAPGIPPGAVMAVAPVQPPVVVVNLSVPAPAQTQGYPYYPSGYDTGYDQYYPSFDSYPYSYPFFAFAVPRKIGFGFGFFNHHGFKNGFHSGVFHGGGLGRHR